MEFCKIINFRVALNKKLESKLYFYKIDINQKNN